MPRKDKKPVYPGQIPGKKGKRLPTEVTDEEYDELEDDEYEDDEEFVEDLVTCDDEEPLIVIRDRNGEKTCECGYRRGAVYLSLDEAKTVLKQLPTMIHKLGQAEAASLRRQIKELEYKLSQIIAKKK